MTEDFTGTRFQKAAWKNGHLRLERLMQLSLFLQLPYTKMRGSSSAEGFVDYPMSNTTRDASHTQEKIKQYLATNSLAEFDAGVTENSDLFKEGFIDSFGYIELVKFLEKEFQIRFTDEELISNQLNTLKNITCMVHSKIDAG